MRFLKVLFTAGLGWWMFGPIGGIIGMLVGNIIANAQIQTINPQSAQRDGFIASLLVLIAAVMKADGKILKSELDFVKAHLINLLGAEQASQALIVLRDIIKKEIPVIDVCHQIRVNMDYNSRIQLLHLLFGLGKADGVLNPNEIFTIKQISTSLGISELDYASVLNMFYDNLEAAYKVLEIEQNSSNEDIKKAYRKMALRFHPDKVIHLGEEFQVAANEKFQKVNEAYEKIKKNRGFN